MGSEQKNVQSELALPPQFAMLQMITGFWVSRAIYIAAKLGLADLVKDGPKMADDLARSTSAHGPSLYRLLRALASVGVFVEDDQKRFAQTPLSETLRSDALGSLRAMAMVELGQEHFPAWGNLMHSVKTGEIAFDNLFKQNAWEYYAQNPEDASNFNDAMRGLTEMVNMAVLAAYDFSGADKIVDVAGGTGGLIGAILKANPQMRGVLFDLPHVIAEAGPSLDRAGVRDRCETATGDFFESVPEVGDAYVMKWIIHDWDDEKSAVILKNIHRAMNENGKLLLLEMVVPEGNQPDLSKFMDLNMMVMTGGRERTEAEFGALMAASGFKLTRVVRTASPVSIVEAVRA
ncbi:MAG: acetylserotonin O-methyltransferase [Acidobacteria bacterium]|nr:acetylserotonin O-methyltransferase [Acidobacteriota bacterium]